MAISSRDGSWERIVSRLGRTVDKGGSGPRCIISERSWRNASKNRTRRMRVTPERVEDIVYVLLDSTSERCLGDEKKLDSFQRSSLLSRRSQSLRVVQRSATEWMGTAVSRIIRSD